MNTLTQAALLGATLGLALTILITRLMPARVDLSDALRGLAGTDNTAATDPQGQLGTATDDLQSRVGATLYPQLSTLSWFKVPTSDLALQGITVYNHIGEKVLSALVGLALPTVIQTMLTLTGHALPIAVPAIAGIALAAVLFLAPDLEVRSKAAKARQEFSRSLGAFIEFVVLNRRGGVGATQALERAASVGDSWVFRRLAAELDKAAMLGKLPWGHLDQLSKELELPELDDLVKTMTLTGEQGASVSSNLSSTASTLRNEHLTKELGDADSSTTKMQAPMALLAVIFMLLLAIAAAGNIINTSM